MTLEALKALIRSARWFQNLGKQGPASGIIPIPNLLGWSKHVSDNMRWLPSSRDQEDPINEKALDEKIRSSGRDLELRAQQAELYRMTLQGLRDVGKVPLLSEGPNDFTEAAKGAALFAVKQAVGEIIAEKPGFWCKLLPIYASGNWPCGIMPNGSVVVL